MAKTKDQRRSALLRKHRSGGPWKLTGQSKILFPLVVVCYFSPIFFQSTAAAYAMSDEDVSFSSSSSLVIPNERGASTKRDLQDLTGWSQVYGQGTYEDPENTDNELWADGSPTSHVVEPIFYVRRLCQSCSLNSHKDITYKRLTPVPAGMDVRNLFLDDWMSAGNILGTDFNLFSTVNDAFSDTNPWLYCDYDDEGIGCKSLENHLEFISHILTMCVFNLKSQEIAAQ